MELTKQEHSSGGDLDVQYLETWIQPQHLTSDAVASYNKAFTSSPTRLLRITDFLLPNVARGLSTFLDSEVEFEKIYHLANPDKTVGRDEWDRARDKDRMSTYYKIHGVRSGLQSLNPLLFFRLRSACSDPKFIAFFEQVTGVPLGPPKAVSGNAYGVGDFLRPHNDREDRRRIAFIIYLNPNWTPHFGGALHVMSHDKKEAVLDVQYNSLVLFDVDSHDFHYIAPINSAAGDQRRLSINGWFNDR